MNKEQLTEILEKHKLWLDDEDGGERAELSNANLRGADLSNATLRDANLYNADLRGADLSYADLRDANLYNAYLSRANLEGADLREADLNGATLEDAILIDADLSRANLIEANLEDADLRGAKLIEANLEDANLYNADLRGTNLKYADLSNANLRDTAVSMIKGRFIVATQGLQGECGRQITLLAEGKEEDWILYCGCFTGTREALNKCLKDNDYEGFKLASANMCVEFLFNLARLAIQNANNTHTHI